MLTPLFNLKNFNLEKISNLSHVIEKNHSMVLIKDFKSDFLQITENINQNHIKTQEELKIEEMIGENTRETHIMTIGILICFKKFCKD